MRSRCRSFCRSLCFFLFRFLSSNLLFSLIKSPSQSLILLSCPFHNVRGGSSLKQFLVISLCIIQSLSSSKSLSLSLSQILSRNHSPFLSHIRIRCRSLSSVICVSRSLFLRRGCVSRNLRPKSLVVSDKFNIWREGRGSNDLISNVPRDLSITLYHCNSINVGQVIDPSFAETETSHITDKIGGCYEEKCKVFLFLCPSVCLS